eukprot:1182290-Prorocentrum_minimum.AAC.2
MTLPESFRKRADGGVSRGSTLESYSQELSLTCAKVSTQSVTPQTVSGLCVDSVGALSGLCVDSVGALCRLCVDFVDTDKVPDSSQ